MPLTVACHQPNFLPWLGFFDKIDRADVFVLLDQVQLIRRSFTTRTGVLHAGRPLQLSLSIAHTGSQDLPIDQARLSGAGRTKKIAASLRQAYGRTPYWGSIGEPVAAVLESPPERLLDLNLSLLRLTMQALGLDEGKLRLQSTLSCTGGKSELMATLTRAAGGGIYLSGGHDPGPTRSIERTGTAADYNDPAVFAAHGVELVYQDFRHPVYPQGPTFASGLSALDALLRLGPQALALVRECNGRAAQANKPPR